MIKVHPEVKALIFDMDGTLADTMPLHFESWVNTCKTYGFEYPQELFQQLAGLPSHKIAPIIFKKAGIKNLIDPLEFARKKQEEFYKNYKRIKPIKPVVNLVHKYYGRLPMSVGSGASRFSVLQSLKQIKLQSYFDFIVTSEDIEHYKPAPDTFLKCAELMQVKPEFCQVFEDGERGIEAARRAGMIVVDVTAFYM
jgi:beta-phosphoglucomutase family hydrolase